MDHQWIELGRTSRRGGRIQGEVGGENRYLYSWIPI